MSATFRTTKRRGRKNVRKRNLDDDEDGEETRETSDLLQEARKRTRGTSSTTTNGVVNASGNPSEQLPRNLLPTYATASTSTVNQQAARVTSTADQHPNTTTTKPDPESNGDGIFRAPKHNAFHAGPLKAPTNVRTTARFDYQQDICKDYKETGFCGYGDTCIYLHDRGDTLTGWQLERQWQAAQDKKKAAQEKEMMAFTCKKATTAMEDETDNIQLSVDDGIPFACHICRRAFVNPVVTNCQHYFCESCILRHVREESEGCPVCGKDTSSVFNQPSKLFAKRRRVLGADAARANDAWEKYYEKFQKKGE